jgi:MSHA biogenesis protein MshK
LEFKLAIIFTCSALLLLSSTTLKATEYDPTRPFNLNSKVLGQKSINKRFVLSSIIHGDGIHTAIINDKIYRVFDYIDDYQITAVNSDSVILRSNTERLKLNVFKRDGFKSKVKINTVVNQ